MAKKRKAAAAAARTRKPGLAYDEVRKLGLALPGVEDSTSYGTPSLKVRGKFMARLREDGESLALRIGFPQREELLHRSPDVFYVTDHYIGYPAVVVRLNKVSRELMAKLLMETWREIAPKKLVAEHDAADGPRKPS